MSLETYKILAGETTFDVAIKLYGKTELLGKICYDNDLTITQTLDAGTNIVWDTEYKLPTPNQISTVAVAPNKYSYFTGLNGQSIYDVCLITYGKLEMLCKLISENGIENLNQLFAEKINFKYEKALINDSNLYVYLQRLASGVGGTLEPTPTNRIFDYTFDFTFN